jgi:hypothetical protein
MKARERVTLALNHREPDRMPIADWSLGGGFVFATGHNIQALVPPENTATMFETALECGKY